MNRSRCVKIHSTSIPFFIYSGKRGVFDDRQSVIIFIYSLFIGRETKIFSMITGIPVLDLTVGCFGGVK